MRGFFSKRKGALADILFIIIMCALVLVMIPVFRALLSDVGQSARNVGQEVRNVTSY